MKISVCIDSLSPGQESHPQWIVAEFFLGLQTPLVWSVVHFVYSGLAKKDLTLIAFSYVFKVLCLWYLICFFALKVFWPGHFGLVYLVAFRPLKTFWSVFWLLLKLWSIFCLFVLFVLVFIVFEMYWLIIVLPLSPDITPEIQLSAVYPVNLPRL